MCDELDEELKEFLEKIETKTGELIKDDISNLLKKFELDALICLGY